MGAEVIAVEVLAALERGATVLTANQRAARSLRQSFDRHCRTQGLTSWQPPMILVWDAWTAGLWRQRVIDGNAVELLLNRTQEHTLWCEVLGADPELASLRSVESLAEMAADAWMRLCSYNGCERLWETTGLSTDTRSFQRWTRVFARRCERDGLLSGAQLEKVLQQAVADGEVGLSSGGVALMGFDAISPAQSGLLQAMRNRGVPVETLVPAIVATQGQLCETSDESTELKAAAHWVRGFLEQQPSARIAVIVPSLEKERAGIDRVFRETLAEELEDIRAANVGPYEFSLGTKLADAPMVATAFDLLRWTGGALPLDRVSSLLLTRYFAGQDENGARAEFDAFELRKQRMLRPEISLEKMVSLVDRSPRRVRLERLNEALRSVMRVVQRWFGGQVRPHAEWSDAIRELLSEARWDTGDGQDSVEFQLRRRWESALDELATLDFDGERVEFSEALKKLDRIARQATFAPESRETPIQVMGPLEATGESFDAVWFLRAGDLHWPLRVSTNPLLPWVMQKELGMPGTDATRDSEQASFVTERIAGSAPVVVFSYAKESAEGRQRASSTLAGMTLERVATETLAGAEPARMAVVLEGTPDGERIAPLPNRVMRGGATVLQLQAACGFRAFAERRLVASELESVELGMDARERGNVVHKVLEVFWGEVKTQRALNSMTETEREEVLAWAIDAALRKTADLIETSWDTEFVELQRERLHILLRQWLELESARPPFEVKLNEESFKDVPVGPLRLNVRVDRVDTGENGEIIIDYKTGTAAPKDWLTERPDAPQLPLYAILSKAPVLEAVAFAQVRAGRDMGLHGFATSNDVLAKTAKLPPGIPTLEAQVEQWRTVLTKLAEDFHRGDSRVRPKNYPKTCEHCGMRLICRIDRTGLEDGSEDEDGEVMGG